MSAPRHPSDADRVELWLASADGTAMAQREMRRAACPMSFDADLARMTMRAAEQMAAKGEAIESVPAWTTLTFRRRIMDLLASPAHRRRVDTGAGPDAWTAAPSGDTSRHVEDHEIAGVLAALELADIRRHIVGSAASVPAWSRSASLSVLSIAVDGCAPGATCPAPAGGADELDAAHWAGLFYASLGDCFPAAHEIDVAAVRQRRKRRIDVVRALLADAYAATNGAERHG